VIVPSDISKIFSNYLPIIMHIHPSSPNSNSSLSEDDAASKIQAGWKGYRVRKQLKNSRRTKNGQNGISANGEKTSIEERSAAKIQAGWKGFKIRKEIKCAREAATKIQANWKGFKARKDLKGKLSKDSNQIRKFP
jgi:hypothetical protein